MSYSLRLRWALLAGAWADLLGGAAFAFFFARHNRIVEPTDTFLLMLYGGATCIVVMAPLNFLLGLVASRLVSRRPSRPPDEILTTTVSLHLALMVLGYGLSSRASQWWFYERSTGLFCSNNLIGLLGWGAAAAAVYFAMQAVWWLRLKRKVRIRALCGGLSAVGFLVPFVYLPPPAGPGSHSMPPPRNALPRPECHVLWIGIDGGDWEILKPAMERGDMPVLADLCRRGVTGPLESAPPYASQPCWVTAATGTLPSTHGVNSRLVVRFPGVRPFFVGYQTKEFLPVYGTGLLLLELGIVDLIPTPRYFWKRDPIWVTLSQAGRKSAVIGWPSTWPADPINGLVVSDRHYFSVWESLYQRHKPGLPGVVHPESWLQRARKLRVDPRQFTAAEAGLFFDPAPDIVERFRAPTVNALRRDPVAYLGRGVGMDMTDLAIAHEALRLESPDFLAVYTTGFDLAAHGFWSEQSPELFPGLAPSGRPEFRDTFKRYCRFLDAEIGRLVRATPADTVVILSSDHGVVPSVHHPVWPVAHDRNGILVVAGPDVQAGARIENARIQDLAPTVSYLLGVPVSPGTEGRVLKECFTPAYLTSHPAPSNP